MVSKGYSEIRHMVVSRYSKDSLRLHKVNSGYFGDTLRINAQWTQSNPRILWDSASGGIDRYSVGILRVSTRWTHDTLGLITWWKRDILKRNTWGFWGYYNTHHSFKSGCPRIFCDSAHGGLWYIEETPRLSTWWIQDTLILFWDSAHGGPRILCDSA